MDKLLFATKKGSVLGATGSKFMVIETRNPATGEITHKYPMMSLDQVKPIIQASHAAFLHWEQTSFSKRADLFKNLVRLLKGNKNKLAELITTEMGKPITDAVKEIEKCAWVCEYFADETENLLAAREVKTHYKKSYVCYQPLGSIFAIMPWNFPFWQVFRFAAPNLMAGNTAVLNHAPITTGCSLAIEELFLNAGFPENVFRTLIVSHEIAEFVIKHPFIRGVTLTGSPRAGRIVAAHAGSALKKVVLELGGNDAYLIMHDADLDRAAESCVASRLANSGQVCIAAKRLIIDESVYHQFEELILDKITHYQMGDPMDPNTNLGPLAREDLRANVHHQVETNLKVGAKLLTGGIITEIQGYFYPPTVITKINETMPVMREEIFGPVLTLIPAANEEHMFELANAGPYGLAAAVFSENIPYAEKIAKEKLHAGTCTVNSYVVSDPRLPFGGIKDSGFGRELSVEGIQEFVNIKTICLS